MTEDGRAYDAAQLAGAAKKPALRGIELGSATGGATYDSSIRYSVFCCAASYTTNSWS